MCILIDVNNRLKIQLEPLALAANITQAAHCCLDHVLLTLGFLYHTYRNLQGHEFAVTRDAVLASLECHWMEADQDVFIAYVILHPWYKSAPIKPYSCTTDVHIYHLLQCLWLHFFSQTPPDDLCSQMDDYLNENNLFAGMSVSYTTMETSLKQEVCF